MFPGRPHSHLRERSRSPIMLSIHLLLATWTNPHVHVRSYAYQSAKVLTHFCDSLRVTQMHTLTHRYYFRPRLIYRTSVIHSKSRPCGYALPRVFVGGRVCMVRVSCTAHRRLSQWCTRLCLRYALSQPICSRRGSVTLPRRPVSVSAQSRRRWAQQLRLRGNTPTSP